MSFDCFLSYASADLALAEELHRKLSAAGFTVWFDKARLRPGYDWYQEIEKGADDSRVLLPILTPHWKESEWTKFETYGAEAVIPLLCGGAFADVSTPPLNSRQSFAVDLSSADTAAYEQLFTSIREILASPPPQRERRLLHLRYHANPYFVGREDELLRIVEQLYQSPTTILTQGRVRAIAALGGVGKTTLARQYAERFWRLYAHIFWVDARIGYVTEFAHLFDLLVPEAADSHIGDEEKARRALAELNGRERRLLILDNVEDEETVQSWIPNTGSCHTLITSRFSGWSAAVQCVQLYELEKVPARTLLLARSGRPANAIASEETAACDRLAEKLGFLPLALEQAGAYIAEQGDAFGFADYLQLYEKATVELLRQRALGATQYPDSVITTWKTTVEKLPSVARAVLRLASYLAATSLPLQLFKKSAGALRQWTMEFSGASPREETTADDFLVREGFGALKRYSMVRFDGQTALFHGLVQTVERSGLTTEETVRWWRRAAEAIEAFGPENSERFENWAIWKVLLPHAEACLEHGRSMSGVTPSTGILRETGGFYFAMGRYDDALPLVRRCLAEREQTLGPNHCHTLEPTGLLATLLEAKGDYQAAEPLFRRCVEGHENIAGDENNVATSLDNLARVNWRLGNFVIAESIYRRALELKERLFGPLDHSTLLTVNNLGQLLTETDSNDQAESLFRRAVEGGERTRGPEHPDTLIAVFNLSTLLVKIGNHTDARFYCQRAFDGFTKILGPDHPLTLSGLNRLAENLFFNGEVATAELHMRSVMAHRENLLGVDHPETLESVFAMSYMLDGQGKLDEAEAYARRFFNGYERTLGLDYYLAIKGIRQLAHLLLKKGDIDAARLMWRRGVEAARRTVGPGHHESLNALDGLASTYLAKAEHVSVVRLYCDSLQELESSLGSDHASVVSTKNKLALSLNRLAFSLQLTNQLDDAEAHYRRALELVPQNVAIRVNCATLYLVQDEFARAEQELRTARKFLTMQEEVAERIDFVRAALAAAQSLDASFYLGQCKTLVESTREIRPSTNTALLKYLRDKVPPNTSTLFDALFQALNNRSAAAQLMNGILEWQSIAAVPLDEPWP